VKFTGRVDARGWLRPSRWEMMKVVVPILVNKPVEPVEKNGPETTVHARICCASPGIPWFLLLVLGLYGYWATIRAALAGRACETGRCTCDEFFE